MPLDVRVEDHHKLQFHDSFMIATQQMGSKLRRFVTEKPCSGEGANVADIIGTVNYKRRVERSRTNIDNPPNRTRRWLVYRDPLETGQYFDREDLWRQIDDPTSELMMAHSAAMGRGVDDTILGIDEDGVIESGGLLGPVVEGKRPGGAGVALPAQYKTVHGSAGLTIAKLRAARKKLGLDENQLGVVRPVMAISTAQNDDLLGIVENASANLNMLEQPHIVNGVVTRLLGFDFVNDVNRLPLSGGVRTTVAWLPQNVVLGVWQDIKTDLYNDTHAGNTPYGKIDAVMDCTRKEDLGVHVIECAES